MVFFLIISSESSVSFVRELSGGLKKNKIWCHQVDIFCIAEKSWQSGSAWISLDIPAL